MLRSIFLLGFMVVQMAASAQPVELANISIIPKPVSVVSAKGSFKLTEKSVIYYEGESTEIQHIGNYLANKLNPSTRFGIKVKSNSAAQTAGNIYLSLQPGDAQLSDEGYQLVISKETVTLTANKPAGLFNGIQTLRQLFPANIESAVPQEGSWEIPAGTVRDYPEYPYRGVMLDVARHFFRVSDVKRTIDLMAAYKMNVMHLHLSDDQGWRIEIKKWPN